MIQRRANAPAAPAERSAADHLGRRRDDRLPGRAGALDRVSLEIDRGEFAFVVGPTGCGKSTLIKMLIRDVEPAAGTVKIAGKDINELDHNR